MTFEEIKLKISKQEIDTVLVCMVDMQGRLMGKRFHAEAFLEMAEDETHCCNYLLATDLEMATPDGYASTSWSSGYGDYIMKPDLGTLRPVPWIEGTAMCLCDVLDHHTHMPVPFSPREVLKTQIAKAEAMGFSSIMATELEFFLFQGTHDEIAENGFRELKPISNYNEDYHIFQTSKEEHVMRPIRNYLRQMGIPVEGSKGEAEAGQEELNIKYSDALSTAIITLSQSMALKKLRINKATRQPFCQNGIKIALALPHMFINLCLRMVQTLFTILMSLWVNQK